MVGETRQWKQGVEFCWCSHTCVRSNTHVQAEYAPCTDTLFEVILSATILFHNMQSVNVLPVAMKSEYSTPLTSQTIMAMILTADTAVLNILVHVILWDWTPLTTCCSELCINLYPKMVLLKNSPVYSRRSGNCWLTSVCFHFTSVGAIGAPIFPASVGRQSFASDAHFVHYSLLRNKAIFIRFFKTVPVSFIGCTCGISPCC